MENKAKEILSRFNNEKHNALVAIDLIIESWTEDGNKRIDVGIINYWVNLRKYIQNEK